MRRRRPLFRPGMQPDEHGLVGVGGRLSVELLLETYAQGVFPWTGRHPIPWFSPDPRMVLEPAAFRARRSLRKRLRQGGFEVRFDTRFDQVMRWCASAPRAGQPGTWITPNMLRVYGELHHHGYGHSVEVLAGGRLVGGLYGLSLGRAFFGESMFHREPDASKIALWALCDALAARDFHFIDCQEETEHLASLGAHPIPLPEFRARLAQAQQQPTLKGSWADWRWGGP